jgi:chorismate mutase
MSLENLRKDIDEIDVNLVKLISLRIQIANQIGAEKKVFGVPVDDQNREAEVMSNISELARREGIEEAGIRDIYKIIIGISKKVQGK